MFFKNRIQAAELLAKTLEGYDFSKKAKTIVLALPRGGVPMGYTVAKQLELAWDIFLVRKIGMPGNEELALGAVAMGGVKVFNPEVMAYYPASPEDLEPLIAKEEKELERRNRLYRQGKEFPDIKDWHILLVDDGIATGATIKAAIQAINAYEPASITVAVPVAPEETYQALKHQVDELICLEHTPEFYGVGAWYQDFPQLTDAEVQYYLAKA